MNEKLTLKKRYDGVDYTRVLEINYNDEVTRDTLWSLDHMIGPYDYNRWICFPDRYMHFYCVAIDHCNRPYIGNEGKPSVDLGDILGQAEKEGWEVLPAEPSFGKFLWEVLRDFDVYVHYLKGTSFLCGRLTISNHEYIITDKKNGETQTFSIDDVVLMNMSIDAMGGEKKLLCRIYLK